MSANPHVCAVCLRQGRGFIFIDPTKANWVVRTPIHACSISHLDLVVHHKGTGEMLDPTAYETQALAIAGEKAGEYLESIGKTDLATLTGEEWTLFLTTIFDVSTSEIGRMVEENALPF
jgi:hypothetical protein